jgi:hypothetical protein
MRDGLGLIAPTGFELCSARLLDVEKLEQSGRAEKSMLLDADEGALLGDVVEKQPFMPRVRRTR